MFIHVRPLLVVTTVALAALAGPTPSAAAAQSRQCIAQPQPDGQAPAMDCFATFAQAIAAATTGRVQLPPNAAPSLLPAADVDAAGNVDDSPSTTVIIGIDFTGTSYSGSSLTWYQSAGCGSYQASSMPAGWNDVIESVANYSGCGTTLYQNINFGGSTFSVGIDGSAPTLGSFNDEASSQKWCAAASC